MKSSGISLTSIHLYTVHCEIFYVMQWDITNQHTFVHCVLRDILCNAVEYH